MALLLIGVMRAEGALPQPLPEAPPHLLVPGAGWVGLAIEVDPNAPTDEAERALAWAEHQHAVLAHYVTGQDVMPIALGAAFSTPQAIADHIAKDHARIAALFDQVAGCCEYILQLEAEALPNPPMAEVGAGGAAFLHRRKGARDARRTLAQRRETFRREVMERASTFSQDTQARQVAGSERMADLSLLIPRAEVAHLTATLSERAAQSDALGVAMRLIGPLPAYSFLSQGAPHA